MRRLCVLAIGLVFASLHTPSRAQIGEGLPACGRAHELQPGPVNAELARVTDSAFTVTWLTCNGGAPAESDGTVTYSELAATSAKSEAGPKTAFHNVTVTGLRPGTTYRYSVTSGGLTAPLDRSNPGVFTTLTAPPGKEVARIAVMADVHIGEDISGIASGDFPPGYRSEKAYSTEMLRGAVAAVNDLDVDLVWLPGDNTSHGDLHDVEVLKRELRKLDAPYMVARGAHDRGSQSKEADDHCPPEGDCFRRVFYPRSQTESLADVRYLKGWAFIVLDSADPETGTGRLDAEQLEWLDATLAKAAAKDARAMVFFHHPVSEYSSTLAIPPAVFGVNHQDAQAFLEIAGRHDVRLILNSHTHRNWIAYSPHTGRAPIVEVGPVKEYPAGVTLLRIYESGLVREWIPVDCAFCNMWRETTRGEYMSLYPLYTLGSLRDRNFVHSFDSPDVPGIPSIPLGLWPPIVPGQA